MIYADYDYYQAEFDGTVIRSHDEFIACARLASAVLDDMTFGRVENLKEIPDRVKDAVCAGAEAVCKYRQRADSNVASESVGGWTRSYRTANAGESARSTAREEMLPYVDGTYLTYRGL